MTRNQYPELLEVGNEALADRSAFLREGVGLAEDSQVIDHGVIVLLREWA